MNFTHILFLGFFLSPNVYINLTNINYTFYFFPHLLVKPVSQEIHEHSSMDDIFLPEFANNMKGTYLKRVLLAAESVPVLRCPVLQIVTQNHCFFI